MSRTANRPRLDTWLPVLAAPVAVGLVVGPLLVGFEPVGGDPDRIFRPIKAELVDALGRGTLPFWSDRFGLGLPLVAESHAAAFYAPDLLLYGLFGVSAGYRLSMWAHMVALAATTAAYARQIGLTAWGAALAAVAFALCGTQAIHSSHEWMYRTLPYLPLALLLVDRYAESGRKTWLGLLVICLGFQWTLGHFQVQTWTNGLVLASGVWRVVVGRPRRWGRIVAIVAAVAAGGAIAAVQLVPSWELARFVGQDARSLTARMFYSFPPAHLAELAIPRLFRGIAGGPEDPYWFGQQTTGFEAAFWIGTVSVLLAGVGLCTRGRGLGFWKLFVVLSLCLATMPRWWPQGYAWVLAVPGVGFFRAPARYLIVASLGLALLAGAGLDRALSGRRFAVGMTLGLAVGVAAFAWAAWWTTRPEVAPRFVAEPLLVRLGPAALSWAVALGAVVAWRRGRLGAGVLVLLTAAELGALYHAATTRWGWAVPLPGGSPILSRLAAEDPHALVGGALDNLPVRAGLATATPYIGFDLPPPNEALKFFAGDRRNISTGMGFLEKVGVTHLVFEAPAPVLPGAPVVFSGPDPALDRLAYRPSDLAERGPRSWSVLRLERPGPAVRVATRLRVLPGAPDPRRPILPEFSDPAEAWVHAADLPADWKAGPTARTARVVRWDGRAGVVEHDGPCLLVINRTYYPGWGYRAGEGPTRAVLRVDGGLQGVWLDGEGPSRVSVTYRPSHLGVAGLVSLVALTGAAGLIVVELVRLRKEPKPAGGPSVE